VKPLLVIPATKEALIDIVLLGYKQVITQYEYDIFVINTCPRTCVNNKARTCVNNKDIILILGYNYNLNVSQGNICTLNVSQGGNSVVTTTIQHTLFL